MCVPFFLQFSSLLLVDLLLLVYTFLLVFLGVPIYPWLHYIFHYRILLSVVRRHPSPPFTNQGASSKEGRGRVLTLTKRHDLFNVVEASSSRHRLPRSGEPQGTVDDRPTCVARFEEEIVCP